MRLLLIVTLIGCVAGEFRGHKQIDPFHKNHSSIKVKAKAPVTRYANDTIDRKPGRKQIQVDKIRGVNLGGWLVLEPWITPSLFESVDMEHGEIPEDEYTYTAILGKDESKRVLEEHWSKFYTEDDFRNIKNMGLNLVRIPVGYWAFGLLEDDPYVQGQEAYLDKAIEWAHKYELLISLDIHGMPGSQNGFDNSGKRTNQADWLSSQTNIDLTYKVLEYFFRKYGDPDLGIHSIEAVNEPFGAILDIGRLQEFYIHVYHMAKEMGLQNKIVYHDAFMELGWWNDFMNDPYYNDMVMDHHLYEIFSTYQNSLPPDQRAFNVREEGRKMSEEPHQCIVGEFSGAITDCSKYINGVGTGARYDGSFASDMIIGSCEGHQHIDRWSDQKKRDTRSFLEVQFETFEENCLGWIFWCYKTEDSIEWDYRRLVEYDLIPNSPATMKSIKMVGAHKRSYTEIDMPVSKSAGSVIKSEVLNILGALASCKSLTVIVVTLSFTVLLFNT